MGDSYQAKLMILFRFHPSSSTFKVGLAYQWLYMKLWGPFKWLKITEPRKKNILLSIESWLVYRDPYNGLFIIAI